MATKPKKSTPQHSFGVRGPTETPEQVSVIEPGQLRRFRVKLRVSGGLPTQRYEFEFATSSDGKAKCGLICRLRDQEIKARTVALPEAVLFRLIGQIDPARLAQSDLRAPQIPPDSLVGHLEITIGRQKTLKLFMADKEQAKTAGYEIEAPLAKAIDAIYDCAENILGMKTVRP